MGGHIDPPAVVKLPPFQSPRRVYVGGKVRGFNPYKVVPPVDSVQLVYNITLISVGLMVDISN